MKVLHAAVSLNPSRGVVQQMESEQQVASSLHLDWKCQLLTGRPLESAIAKVFYTPGSRLHKYAYLRLKATGWLRSVSADYDVVLLRHSVFDVFQASLSKSVRNIWLVHHTLDLPELQSLGPIKGTTLRFFEQLIGNSSLRYAAGHVCVTEEIANSVRKRVGEAGHNKSIIIYPNGSSARLKPAEDNRGSRIVLLFVASALPSWHGMDLLAESLRSSSKDVELHVVGNILPAAIIGAEEDRRFVFHGEQSMDRVRQIGAGAHVAISCLALERKGMQEACPLKVRDYLMLGIPVYGNYRDPGLPDDFAYYRRGPASIDAIVQFANETKHVGRAEISATSEPFIDKTKLMTSLTNSLARHIKKLPDSFS